MQIEFTKMSGAGNDFIVIDNRDGRCDRLDGETIRRWCRRRVGVGADGLILIERDPDSDFFMRYFNSDGKEAELCANGARCAVLFVYGTAKEKREFRFRSRSDCHVGRLLESAGSLVIEVDMPVPKEIEISARLKLEGEEFEYDFAVVGVPHVVITSEGTVAEKDILELGRKIRYHPKFEPRGTNVNFIQITSHNSLEIRTYERGVEDETLACGTGSVASAIVTAIRGLTSSPVHCLTRGRELLMVSFDADSRNRNVSSVRLQGGAKIIYQGRLETCHPLENS